MVLDASLLNTQHYKLRIKGKVEKSRERSSTPHVGVVAIEKVAFGMPLTTVTNLTLLLGVKEYFYLLFFYTDSLDIK